MAKMINCKHCGEEISSTAKICPKCGGKQSKPIYKKPWFIVLIALILIGIAAPKNNSSASSSENKNSDTAVKSQENEKSENNTAEETEAAIEYTEYNVSELMDDLNGNALKANEKYDEKYVTITGKLSVIDSSGKYISLVSDKDAFAIIGIKCYIKNDEQKARVMDMSAGDIVTLSGKIKEVGEVLGYSLDIDSIQ